MFREHCSSEGHQGIQNWSIILIDQFEDLDSSRRNELYWINRLKPWIANVLNIWKVYGAYYWVKNECFLEKSKGSYLNTHEKGF